jgi:hypothetical protein
MSSSLFPGRVKECGSVTLRLSCDSSKTLRVWARAIADILAPVRRGRLDSAGCHHRAPITRHSTAPRTRSTVSSFVRTTRAAAATRADGVLSLSHSRDLPLSAARTLPSHASLTATGTRGGRSRCLERAHSTADQPEEARDLCEQRPRHQLDDPTADTGLRPVAAAFVAGASDEARCQQR